MINWNIWTYQHGLPSLLYLHHIVISSTWRKPTHPGKLRWPFYSMSIEETLMSQCWLFTYVNSCEKILPSMPSDPNMISFHQSLTKPNPPDPLGLNQSLIHNLFSSSSISLSRTVVIRFTFKSLPKSSSTNSFVGFLKNLRSFHLHPCKRSLNSFMNGKWRSVWPVSIKKIWFTFEICIDCLAIKVSALSRPWSLNPDLDTGIHSPLSLINPSQCITHQRLQVSWSRSTSSTSAEWVRCTNLHSVKALTTI